MRSGMTIAALLLAFVLLGAGCGGGKEAGEPCSSTGEGAAQCESNVCLAVDCSGTARRVCGGDQCAPGAGECGGGVCVSSSGGSYCLPTDVCVGVTTSSSPPGR
jgi:hypothetical protein